MNKEDFYKVPIGGIIRSPKSGNCAIITDKYWAVVDGSVLFYRIGDAPQCNAVEAITKRLVEQYGSEAYVEFIHKAFIPIKIYGEYDYDPQVIDRQNIPVEDGKYGVV